MKKKTFEQRLGNCYELNFIAVTKDIKEGWLLVHGNCINPKTGEKQGHAWCEKEVILNERCTETLVYDAIGELLLPKDAYYRLGHCEPIVKYTAQEAIEMVLNTGHYGYWEHADKMGITKKRGKKNG